MQKPAEFSSRLLDYLVIGLWAGILSGLLEAVVALLLRPYPAIFAFHKSGLEAVWVIPLVNVVALSVVAVIFGTLTLWFSKLPRELIFLGGVSWIGLYGVLGYPMVIAPLGLAFLCLGISVVICRAAQGRELALITFCRRNCVYLVLFAFVIGAGVPGLAALKESLAIGRSPVASTNQPNVLLIVVDTLRADRLSVMGYSRPTTPSIDQLARAGVLFEKAFATASWTLPSHATILTGKFTFQHHMDLPTLNVQKEWPELPQILASHGYHTALFSANTDVVTPDFFPNAFQHNDVYSPLTTAERSSLLRKIVRWAETHFGVHTPPRRASAVNRSFLSWVDQPRQGPFFALLNYIDVHDHYKRAWPPPPPFDTLFGRVEPLRDRDIKKMPKSDIDRAYDELTAYVDAQLGFLLQQLHERGLDRNTLLVVTSDHGESLMEHGLFAHQSSLYREQTQVPLILWFPGRLPAGIRVREPVSLVNLASTITGILELPPALPGEPLPIADNPATASETLSREPLLAELYDLKGLLLRSLLTSRWHYITNVRTGKEELFDFLQDPGELNDLASSGNVSGLIEDVRKKLRERFAVSPSR